MEIQHYLALRMRVWVGCWITYLLSGPPPWAGCDEYTMVIRELIPLSERCFNDKFRCTL